MNWKISSLNSLPNQTLEVSESLKFEQSMFNKVSNIKGVEKLEAKGFISLVDNKVVIDLAVNGIMKLPCANTNEVVDYPFEFEINDMVDEEYEEVVDYKHDNINAMELLWQRLIVEAPAKFVKNDVEIKSGKSWKLISEEEYYTKKDDEIDPRLAKLKDLFIEKEE